MRNVDVSEFQGPLTELMQQCSGENGRPRFDEFKLWLKKIGLLKFIREVAVGGTKRFVARDAFGENNADGIKFYLWPNFTNNFLGKVEEEENVKPTTIAIHRLEKLLRDSGIMAELGIDIMTRKGVIKLAHFHEMLKAQSQGQEGPLLVNGYVNIAYIEDENGVLWAVCSRWARRKWHVRTLSVEAPGKWPAGRQVLSQVS